jgi:peptidoglycan/xylan/chitin deacetylase (PgdA/CDA1 family)
MFHYVRPIAKSIFPNIKGLELENFKKQLDYLQENYSIVRSEDVIEAVVNNKKLPINPCWLTFDDGFKDHINYVMPELLNRKLTGAFFPLKKSTIEPFILNVHALHYILSCNRNNKNLVSELNSLSIEHGITKSKLKLLYSRYAIKNRFDDANTIYIKRMLQQILPEKVRNNIITILFKKYVGIDRSDFAKKVYMNIDEISKLIKNGMYVGNHSDTHAWLNNLSKLTQRKEILSSMEFLESIGAPTSNWIMCYPYGAYNNDTLSLVKELGASIGITTEPRKANLSIDNPFTLPRLDTNDFPK